MYPAKFKTDLLVLVAALAVPFCVFYFQKPNPEPQPPRVDMSEATLVYYGSTGDIK
jgi:hypothetical protein